MSQCWEENKGNQFQAHATPEGPIKTFHNRRDGDATCPRLTILLHFQSFSNVQWLLTVFLIDLISDRELEFSEGMNK